MKHWTFLLLMLCMAAGRLAGQAGLQGMNFQAQARDLSGRVVANEEVRVRIGFSAREEQVQTYYSEVHQVRTGTLGLFQLLIGDGSKVSGSFSDIPWAERQIWMDVELETVSTRGFELLNSTRLQAVPYAFYAGTANQLADEEAAALKALEKNQSIRWTTSGNNGTDTAAHFVGTRDQQNLVIKTNNIERLIITKEGQLQYTGGVPSGPDNLITSYPMVIQGSKQGIHIKVNGSRTGANNFLTFGDDVEFLWGAVEGQTFPELEIYWRYQLQVAVYALQGATLAANSVALVAKNGGLLAAIVCAAISIIFIVRIPGLAIEAAAVIVASVVTIVQAAALINEGVEWGNGIRRDIGVTYSTGAADYAEYLERLPSERDLEPGEIVGVKGGKVSLNTQDANHLMVVSSQPFFLGNAPQPDQEHLFEKVAFMGQVPVRVVAPVQAGDYILPSGNQDGIGIAVNPGKMRMTDFAQVVGIAWESTKDDQGPIQMVNIGVGLHSNNALAPKVEELSNRIDNIIAYLEGKAPLQSAASGNGLSSLASSLNAATIGVPSDKLMSDAEYDKLIESMESEIKATTRALEQQLRSQGADLPDSPELEDFFNNPTAKLKAMRRDPAMARYWGLLDQELIKLKE